MPIIHISIIEGRDASAVKACLKAIARSVHETLDVPLESIRVYANEVPPTHWAIGERTKDELGAPALENGK